MSFDAWKRLEDLEKYIHEHFDNSDCPKKDCPAKPHVHIVYAHYAALPDVERNVSRKWVFPTLTAYDACKSQEKPRSTGAAMDFLAGHFLWVRTGDAKLDALPKPPLEEAVAPTLASDGGTLVHFINTEFPALKPTPEEARRKQAPVRKVKVMTPALVDDLALIDRYDQTVTAKAHSPTKKDTDGKTLSEAGPDGTAPAAEPPRPAGPIETIPGYPRLRRICLSLAGEEGDHVDVDSKGAANVNTELPYRQEGAYEALRLLCVSPGFKFKIGGAESNDLADPWYRSTKAIPGSPTIWETSSNVWLGTINTNKYGTGLVKPISSLNYPGPRLTTTKNLAQRFGTKLGKSRSLVFLAMEHVEGPCEAVQTYDAGILSWGINQWTAAGEIFQIVCYIHDFFPNAFARRFAYYGIGAWFSGRSINWDRYDTPYLSAVLYRMPCCGPRVRVAMKAVLEDWSKAEAAEKKAAEDKAAARKRDVDRKAALEYRKATAAAKKAGKPPPAAPEPAPLEKPEPPAEPPDLPPKRKRYLAKALQISTTEYLSLAMCYVFTTAGADPEIQEAMAQWMSYRITSTHPCGKSMGVVIQQFIDSLRPSAAESTRRMGDARTSLEHALLPESKLSAAPAVDAKIAKLEHRVKTAQSQPPTTKVDKAKLAALEKELKAAQLHRDEDIETAAKPIAKKKVEAMLGEPFSDDDADEAWIRWPTRCAEAGKTTSGKLVEQETAPPKTK